jgi:hypothetical protein
MAPATKRQRQSQSANAIHMQNVRKKKEWNGNLEQLRVNATALRNPNGKSRSEEDNRLILTILLWVVEQKVVVEWDKNISWTAIDKQVSNMVKCDRKHVTKLRNHYMKTGEVAVFDVKGRGGASDTFDRDKQVMIKSSMLIEVAKYVDEMHLKGASVTNSKIRGFVKDKYNINVSRRSVQ